ncbi:MAG: SDR family oxidoreductase [Verrucomicrobia bacterium]|nr:SDR family oxidoreductase [Verrucomicrobiota bacterium]
MSQRVVLITGANGGLGQAIARAFLDEREDNALWLGVHTRRDQVERLVAEHPARCRCVSLDVTDPSAWARAMRELTAATGRLDVLVNNAGRQADGLLGLMQPEAWRRVLGVNLEGVFHGCQAALPTMIGQRSGRIVSVASLSALLAPAGQTSYAAAKAGVLAMTQALAKEVARLGITVNAVCPGYVDTEALASLSEAQRQAALARVPMRRFGQPAEVAAAVRFLACPAAGYITGSILKIDGGIL